MFKMRLSAILDLTGSWFLNGLRRPITYRRVIFQRRRAVNGCIIDDLVTFRRRYVTKLGEIEQSDLRRFDLVNQSINKSVNWFISMAARKLHWNAAISSSLIQNAITVDTAAVEFSSV